MQPKVTKTIAVSINSTPITRQEIADSANPPIIRELFPENIEINGKKSIAINTSKILMPEIKTNLADSAVLVAEVDYENQHQEEDPIKAGLKVVILSLIIINALDLAFEMKKNGITPVLLTKMKDIKIMLQQAAVFIKNLPHQMSTEILPKLLKEFKNLPYTLKLAVINALRSN